MNADTNPADAPTRSNLTAAEIAWSHATLDRAIITEEDERCRLRWTWTLNETIGNAQTWYDLNDDLRDNAMFDNAKRVLKIFLSESHIDGTILVHFSRNSVKFGPA